MRAGKARGCLDQLRFFSQDEATTHDPFRGSRSRSWFVTRTAQVAAAIHYMHNLIVMIYVLVPNLSLDKLASLMKQQ